MKTRNNNYITIFLLTINSAEFLSAVISLLYGNSFICVLSILLLSFNLLIAQLLQLMLVQEAPANTNSSEPPPPTEAASKLELAIQLQTLTTTLEQTENAKKELESRLDNALKAPKANPPVFFHCPLTASVPVNVNAFLAEYLNSWQESFQKKNFHISYYASDELPETFFSLSALTLACNNLFDNILKFTPADGDVCIRLAKIDSNVLIILKNSGNGICESEAEQVFTLNYQGDNHLSGTGLGLTQTKAIVTAFGGNIWVKSSRDSGFTIYLQLPRYKITAQN